MLINMKRTNVLVVLVSFFCLSSSWATSMLPITLEQLSTQATLIFYGSVTANQVKKDELSGRIATFTEFQVIELIKGEAGNKHTIKQIGGQLKETGTTLRVHGVPEFQTGKHYVVFLPEESTLGFCSPLGLHQGRFDVSTVNGEQVVSNGRRLIPQTQNASRNAQLPLAVKATNPAQSRLDDFIHTVRAFNTP